MWVAEPLGNEIAPLSAWAVAHLSMMGIQGYWTALGGERHLPLLLLSLPQPSSLGLAASSPSDLIASYPRLSCPGCSRGSA